MLYQVKARAECVYERCGKGLGPGSNYTVGAKVNIKVALKFLERLGEVSRLTVLLTDDGLININITVLGTYR